MRRGKGGSPFHFPEMAEIYSSVAENIMSRDLEISAEMALRGWVEEIKENPNPLPLLGNTCKMSLPFSFILITEPGITAGIEVSRTQRDAAVGCHGSGAP